MKMYWLAALSVSTLCVAQNESKISDLQAPLQEYQAEYERNAVRVGELVAQLKKMDTDLEGSITKTLDFSRRYNDSADTRERIMKSKASITKDLIRSVEHYRELQKDLLREIAMDRTYLRDDAVALYTWADGKITVRIGQITEITTSLGGYDLYSSGIAYDDDNENYEREKRLAEEAVKEKTAMIRTMRDTIQTLQKRDAELEKELADARSHRSVDQINLELKTVNDKIAQLEASVDEIFEAEAYGKRVGKNASREIEKELRNRVNDIKSRSESFFSSFDALLRLLRMQKSLSIQIEKYEFAIEQLQPAP